VRADTVVCRVFGGDSAEGVVEVTLGEMVRKFLTGAGPVVFGKHAAARVMLFNVNSPFGGSAIIVTIENLVQFVVIVGVSIHVVAH